MADFKETHVALAVIEIPFERGSHGHETGGTKHAGFLGKRIGEAGGRDIGRAEQGVALFGHVRDGEDFAIAEADQPFAQTRFGFVVRKASGSLARGGQARRKFVEAVDARNFFDEVDFARHFGAPWRLSAFPDSQDGAGCAAILIDAHGSKPECAKDGFDFLVGHVGAHDAKKLGARDEDFFVRGLAGINVDNSGEQFAASKLQDEFGAAARGKLRHFRVGAAAEARGSFGVELQGAGGAANGDGIEPGAFDQNVFGGEGDFGFRAAHDAADADDARAVAIANDASAGIELAFDAVESFYFFTLRVGSGGARGLAPRTTMEWSRNLS